MKTIDKINEYIDSNFPNRKKELGFDGRNECGKVIITNSKLSTGLLPKAKYICTDSNPISKHEDKSMIGDNPACIRRIVANDAKEIIMEEGYENDKENKAVNDSLDKNLREMMVYNKSKNSFDFITYASSRLEKEGTPIITDSNVAIQDSIVEGAIQPWNVGILNRIIRQPYVLTRAGAMWKKEGFTNPFCEYIALPKADFEGYGRITGAKGNIKNNSNMPTSANASCLYGNVYDVTIDYHSDFFEDVGIKMTPANWIAPQLRANRERYTKETHEFTADVLFLYGDEESGISGLMQASDVVAYSGTAMSDILKGSSMAKGAEILEAFKMQIEEFLAKGNYMAKELNILCSIDLYKALRAPLYSKYNNPDSPIQTLASTQGASSALSMNIKSWLEGTFKDITLNIYPDVLCNANSPFNPNPYDVMFMTTPIIEDRMGTQDSLIIAPEPLPDFIAPSLFDRQGILYTHHKRIGDLMAPVEGTAQVIMGFGVNG